MSFEMTFYKVAASTYSFKQSQHIGCYVSKATAMHVCDQIRNRYLPIINGGIDVTIQAYRDRVVRCEDGSLRLENMSGGRIISIIEQLDQSEARRINDFQIVWEEVQEGSLG